MKKFINEYKALRCKSETETSKDRHKVDSAHDMGVFKWLRRERVTVTQEIITPPNTSVQEPQAHSSQSAGNIGTIRTEEYKRDLAEFQARRSTGNKDQQEQPQTPVKKKTGRHSLPVSCTACTTDHDNTFNYEKNSAVKYKKKLRKRSRSATEDDKIPEGLPNIQFLFQNQVFMPGHLYPISTLSEPQKTRRHSRHKHSSPEYTQKQINFDLDQSTSPPLFYKNNSLPFNVQNFLEDYQNKDDDVDGMVAEKASRISSHSSLEHSKGSEDRLCEVMNDLKQFDRWADEQLRTTSSKSDDSKSDSSAYGMPLASGSNLNIEIDRSITWNHGSWGVVPVQVKRLGAVTMEHVKKKLNTELNILRKYRHPNIILLMGLYPDVQNNVFIVCENCIDTLHGILHVQGRILSAQTSVHYALDIANALVFLRMQGFIHTELTSHSIMINSHDAAKLADLGPCVRLGRQKPKVKKRYDMYSPEPLYVNIEDTQESTTTESEPLISQHSSETYLASNAVSKSYKQYHDSELYRWQAPELFEPDEEDMVHPCAKSDVYSLCLILWESCNAAVPWKTLTYEKLKELYTLWNTGIRLPQDGTYPGSLLALLQSGLKLVRAQRMDLDQLQSTLEKVARNLDDLEYIIIPARLTKKKSNFSSTAWDSNSPTDESDCLSPLANNVKHKAVVHKRDSSSSSEKEKVSSPMYESLRKGKHCDEMEVAEKCYISDDENSEQEPVLKYKHLPEKGYSSACSTPIAKIRARITDIGTPGALHRSDSTEYCSFFSPDDNFNNDSNAERPHAKLSRSFTPKSYKPLHIKVPECNFDSVKSILKDNSSEKSSYNFDIKNYSLPTTPIARSNKLRRNAWLSGDLNLTQKSSEKKDGKTPVKDDKNAIQSAPETPALTNYSPDAAEKEDKSIHMVRSEGHTPESMDIRRDSFTGLKRVEQPRDFSPETDEHRDRTSSWSYKSSLDRAPTKYKIEEDVLASVSVKPLVAIHEKWIYEANRKTGRSMSLPEDNRCPSSAVKPASHCVDTLQKSLPQLNQKKTSKPYRARPVSPASSGKSGGYWEQFCQARDAVAKNMNFGNREYDKFHTWRKDTDKGTVTEDDTRIEPKIDQATDTRSIEEFIKDLIRKEFQYLIQEITDDTSSIANNEEIVDKGVANIVENLKNADDLDKSISKADDEQILKKDTVKSFSRVKINGNNKPLLQITFNRSGENSLQVLDNCVNVTICDNKGKDKMNVSIDDTLTSDDIQVNSLKRCQAFNAIQEARSTEDLYIDDELSTHMAENFGGRVKLIPLHGSLHEILCEKEDDCCLIKVKQENGCDTIYFKCDNSETESRDAIDGPPFENNSQDTVVYKRSISLVEERIQRIPREKKVHSPPLICRSKNSTSERNEKVRPKSEMFVQTINEQTRVLSTSSPSLLTPSLNKNDEVEVNIENVMSYQDSSSSSDECIKCQLDTDDFELLEKTIEAELSKNTSITCRCLCRCLEKISEENLAVLEPVDTIDKEEDLAQ